MDGTPAGDEAFHDCMLNAFGSRWMVHGVPHDQSKGAILQWLKRTCGWTGCKLEYGRMTRRTGKKDWRVLVPRECQPPPTGDSIQLQLRGSPILRWVLCC